MNKLKVATFGWRNEKLDQISRIDRGLIQENCELDYINPALIFANNPSFEEPLALAAFCPKAKLIFNCLDVPIHHDSYPFKLIESQLARADAICSISLNTQKEVKRVYGFDSHLIYQPLKIIRRCTEIKKDIDILFCGRVNDPNKRFWLVLETAHKLGMKIHVCGSENPNNSLVTYHGVVSDYDLNLLYNRSKYYICATKNAGIELQIGETAFSSTLALACNDNPTAYEFLEEEFIVTPNSEDLTNKIIELEKNRAILANIRLKNAPLRYKKLHYLEVAKSILEVYNKL